MDPSGACVLCERKTHSWSPVHISFNIHIICLIYHIDIFSLQKMTFCALTNCPVSNFSDVKWDIPLIGKWKHANVVRSLHKQVYENNITSHQYCICWSHTYREPKLCNGCICFCSDKKPFEVNIKHHVECKLDEFFSSINDSISSLTKTSQIARFMGPTWGPSGADRSKVGPILTPWTLLSGTILLKMLA